MSRVWIFLILSTFVTSGVNAETVSLDCVASSQYKWDDMPAFDEYQPRKVVHISGDPFNGYLKLSGFDSGGVFDGDWYVDEKVTTNYFGSVVSMYVFHRKQPERSLPELKKITLMESLKTGSILWVGEDGVIAVALDCKKRN